MSPSGQRTIETRFDSHPIVADNSLWSRPCNDYITINISEYINGLCREKIMGNDDKKYLYTQTLCVYRVYNVCKGYR